VTKSERQGTGIDVTKDTRQPPRRPASRIVEHATPFGRYVQITDFGDGVTEIIPVIERPTLLHKLVLQCPCECQRWVVLRVFEDGTITLQPYTRPLGGEPDDDIFD
jgi:hypothetical protein